MKNNNKLFLIIFLIVFVLVVGVLIFTSSDHKNINYNNIGSIAGDRTLFIQSYQDQGEAKVCKKNSDCKLTKCSGCFNKEFLNNSPPDLPCSKFEGYRCVCQSGQCREVK